MKNLSVRELTIDDDELFDEFILEQLINDQIYLTDTSLLTKKKYIYYHDFKEWYASKNENSKIYLVFTNFKKNKLIGAFEIHDYINKYGSVSIDIRPFEKDKGYENIILNFIYNICKENNINDIIISTNINNLQENKNIENIDEINNVYIYKYNRCKTLIK